MTTSRRLVLTDDYQLIREETILAGPDDSWIEASLGTTKALGSDREKASKGLKLDFFSDYEYGAYHLRQRSINNRICWTHQLVVLACEWLPKNRVNLLCIDTDGDTYVLISGYNYRAGKGSAEIYRKKSSARLKLDTSNS